MYHGAEHKTINCIENGFELTVENVRWQSKQHKRCGTSFMLLVMVISAVFFILLRPETLLWKVITRLLIIPLIAGLSYEFIRYAGKHDNSFINILSKPGLWLQGLTTKEPDDAMIEVAIQSVEAVFDWRAFLNEEAESAVKKNKKFGPITKEQVAELRKDLVGDVPEDLYSKEQAKKNSKNKKNNIKATTNNHQKPNSQKAVEDDDFGLSEQAATIEKTSKPKLNPQEEEDDEILKALDKYLDFNEEKASKGK